MLGPALRTVAAVSGKNCFRSEELSERHSGNIWPNQKLQVTQRTGMPPGARRCSRVGSIRRRHGCRVEDDLRQTSFGNGPDVRDVDRALHARLILVTTRGAGMCLGQEIAANVPPVADPGIEMARIQTFAAAHGSRCRRCPRRLPHSRTSGRAQDSDR